VHGFDAAVLLVGNEILSGKVADENAGFLAQELTARGVVVRRIVVVPDDVPTIVEALVDLRARVDFVVTSGGIGPTHDDVTVEAVANALERPLERHPALVRRAREIFGEGLGGAHLKMATVPRGVTLVESERTRWPTMVVDDVYVLAGVPSILRRGFDAIRDLLPRREPRCVATVIVRTDEWALAPLLDGVVAGFPDVAVGSYPVLGQGRSFHVRVVVEGAARDRVAAAVAALVAVVPAGDLESVTPS
jgi:molybdenum cofactor synthesis domain-containing protein